MDFSSDISRVRVRVRYASVGPSSLVHCSRDARDADTRLRVRPYGGDWQIVTLNPGDMLVFRGDVCHNGLGYATLNYRVHAYVYAPDYTPPPSAINNGCAHGEGSAD